MGLIRNIFWIAFFLISTFVFIVIFEHGPTNFVDNAKKEADQIQIVFGVRSKAEVKKEGVKAL